MKILILSCNTGGGHNSAGSALKKYFSDRGIYCEMTDALAFLSKKASSFVSKGHVFVYRKLPRLFGAGYKYEEKHPPKMLYSSMAMAAPQLRKAIVEQGYDTVICVHVFAAMMMTAIKRRYGEDVAKIKTYFVATDYTCSPGVAELDVDGFFTPHALLSDEFVSKGVPEDKIIPSGIPIKEDFIKLSDKHESRKILRLPENAKIILLSFGSMGAGPVFRLTKLLAEHIEDDMFLVVVCGTNNELYRKISNGIPDSKNIRIIGYTEQLRQYMSAADLLITKPGGLSTTEAFYQRLPFISLDAVPGCETRNLEFFRSQNLTETDSDINSLAALIIKRLCDKDYLEKISKKAEKLFEQDPTQTLCDHIIENSNNKETFK